jgi:hypothetical protein
VYSLRVSRASAGPRHATLHCQSASGQLPGLLGCRRQLAQELRHLPFLGGLGVRRPSANARRTTIAGLLSGEVATDRRRGRARDALGGSVRERETRGLRGLVAMRRVPLASALAAAGPGCCGRAQVPRPPQLRRGRRYASAVASRQRRRRGDPMGRLPWRALLRRPGGLCTRESGTHPERVGAAYRALLRARAPPSGVGAASGPRRAPGRPAGR